MRRTKASNIHLEVFVRYMKSNAPYDNSDGHVLSNGCVVNFSTLLRFISYNL